MANQVDDEDDDELETPAAAAPASPTAALPAQNPSSHQQLRGLLDSYLTNKFTAGPNPYTLGPRNADNAAFLATLAKSAAQAGAVGKGQIADTSSLDKQAKAVEDQDVFDRAQLNKNQDQQDTIAKYLEGKFSQEDVRQQALAQQNNIVDKKLKQQKDLSQFHADASADNKNNYSDKDFNKDAMAIGKELDAGPRSETGPLRQKDVAASKVKALFDQYPNPNDMPVNVIKDLAYSMAVIQTGNNVVADRLVQDITPHTGFMDIAKALGYATNEMSPANAGDIVNTMKSFIDREAFVNEEARKAATARIIGHAPLLVQNHPEWVRSELKKNGIDMDTDIDNNFQYQPKKYQPPTAVGTPAAGAASPGKTEVKRQYSPSQNKTKIIYSDGTSEIVDGNQPS